MIQSINLEYIIIAILSAFLVLLIFKLNKLFKQLSSLQEKQKKELSLKKSKEVLFGQSAEKIAPFLDSFGFDPQKCQFLGQPIDYVVFDDDEVVFVEIKTGKARLTQKQKHIKDLILNKKIGWKEVRI